MKPGDLVRCKVWGQTGIIIKVPRNHGYDGRPGKLYMVLWADGKQIVEHINNLEPLNAAG
jgi:hypothetical protein